MNREDLRELLQRGSFEPFRIRASSGDAYEIRDPNSVALLKNRVLIAFSDGQRWTFCPYLHIAAIESLPAV